MAGIALHPPPLGALAYRLGDGGDVVGLRHGRTLRRHRGYAESSAPRGGPHPENASWPGSRGSHVISELLSDEAEDPGSSRDTRTTRVVLSGRVGNVTHRGDAAVSASRQDRYG